MPLEIKKAQSGGIVYVFDQIHIRFAPINRKTGAVCFTSTRLFSDYAVGEFASIQTG